jgi:hypothetical protein
VTGGAGFGSARATLGWARATLGWARAALGWAPPRRRERSLDERR